MAKREKGLGGWDKVTKKGVEFYRFRKVYDDGIRKEFTGKTKAAVKRKVEEYERKELKICNTEYNKMTLGECMDNVLNILQPTLKKTNYATLRSTYRCYILTNNIKDVQMGNLNPLIIQKYYNELAQRYSESTVKKTRTLLNIVLSHLVDTNILTTNPATGAKMPHKENFTVQPREQSFLSYDESEKFYNTALIKATETTPGVRTGDYIYGRNALFCIIILYTGMRVGEAYALKWQDIDFSKNVIQIKSSKKRIKNETTGEYEWVVTSVKKASSVRTIPMTSRVQNAFKLIETLPPVGKTKDSFVFVTGNNIPPSQSTLTRTLHAILDRADIPSKGFGLHDLRHSFGSILLEKGWKDNKPVDIKVISELLGHKDISTTYNIYMHIMQSHKAEALSLLE